MKVGWPNCTKTDLVTAPPIPGTILSIKPMFPVFSSNSNLPLVQVIVHANILPVIQTFTLSSSRYLPLKFFPPQSSSCSLLPSQEQSTCRLISWTTWTQGIIKYLPSSLKHNDHAILHTSTGTSVQCMRFLSTHSTWKKHL